LASCPDCKKGCILPGEPKGNMVDGAYLAAGPGDTSRGIILLTDIFGLPLVNSKIIADRLADNLKCDVWVPDLFQGKPPITIDKLKTPEVVGEKINWPSFLWNIIPSIPAIFRNRPPVAYPRAATFVEKLRSEKKYGKLGAVGYCFGGSVGLIMASKDLLDSVVICHPGTPSKEEINAIKIPSSWACAEEDMAFKPETRRMAEELLAARKGKDNFVEYEFKDYKGTVHGFAARPRLDVPEAMAGFEGAMEQTIKWFDKTLV